MLVCAGDTKVICTASVEAGVPSFLRGRGEGWVTAEYGLLPRATGTRCDREAARGKQTGRTQEIQRLIGRSLRAVVDRKKLGEFTIKIDCDVIQADGGTRCASITGGFVALRDAVTGMLEKGDITEDPILAQVSAVSVGVSNGRPVLDLNYIEDSSSDTDMNVVMTSEGKFVEIQGTAEGEPFSEEELAETDAHNKSPPERRQDNRRADGPMRSVKTVEDQHDLCSESIHPDEVIPCGTPSRSRSAVTVTSSKFCREAAAGLGFSFEPQADGSYRLPLETVKTDSIAVRLSDEGFGNNATVRLDELHRSSPLVSALAEGIVNEAMSGDSCVVVRSAVTESTSVEMLSRVYLLRLRYQIRVAYRNRTQRILTAEEILPVAAVGTKTVSWDCSDKVRELVKLPAQGNLSADLASRYIAEAEALLGPLAAGEGPRAELAGGLLEKLRQEP